jgi:hypothetical protein
MEKRGGRAAMLLLLLLLLISLLMSLPRSPPREAKGSWLRRNSPPVARACSNRYKSSLWEAAGHVHRHDLSCGVCNSIALLICGCRLVAKAVDSAAIGASSQQQTDTFSVAKLRRMRRKFGCKLRGQELACVARCRAVARVMSLRSSMAAPLPCDKKGGGGGGWWWLEREEEGVEIESIRQEESNAA